ncbi:MAG: sensor histidine kinase, partial [Planctomycetota bacterium]
GKLSHLDFTSRDRTFLSALAGQAETALARLEARSDADELERLTEAVFQSMTNAVAVLDGSGEVLRCNPEFTRMFGPARGKDLRELKLEAALAAGGPGPREIEVGGRTLLVTSRPLGGRADEDRTVLVLVDVTELRRLQELSRRRAALAEIGATVSSINHEIGNIISPLNHYMDRARRAPDEQKAAEYLEAARKRIKSLDGLTRELRAYYREPDLSLRSVVLRDIVEGTLADLRAAAGGDWVPPETTGLDLTISADPQKAKQVFLNVLKNSWEAMSGSETRRWSVSARADNGRVVAEIRDSGPGIAPEHLDRLFEPFFTTKRERGTGLGLAITRRIVEAHGGEMSVESRPGEGACFVVHWPTPG